jgi:hypothetical protein
MTPTAAPAGAEWGGDGTVRSGPVLLRPDPTGTSGVLQVLLDPEAPAPEGASAAACAHCHQTIYRRDNGHWTLGRPPWWCFPSNEMIDVLAQMHAPAPCSCQSPSAPDPRPPPAPAAPTTTALYRLYDDAGALIYVGISNRWIRRVGRHAATKDWWREVATVTRQVWPSRAEALAAEALAIRTERPRYNVAGVEPAHEDDLSDDG